jgi:biotin carboxyl carrier protein
MEHSIRAPHDGVLSEILVTVGQAVGTGTVLAVVEEQE